MSAALAAMIVVSHAAASQNLLVNTKVPHTSTQDFQKILDLTNAEREKEHLPKLELDSRLMFAAQYLAFDMASKNYFDHVDSQHRILRQRLESYGAWFTRACENISAGQRTGEDAFRGWFNSPDHRENLMNPEVTQVGFGVAYNLSSTYRTYWVMDFRKPREYQDETGQFNFLK